MQHSPQQVEKINFLIHPGFLSSLDEDDVEFDDFSVIDDGINLLPIYEEKAQKISVQDNEILIIFTHSTREELKNAIGEKCAYIQAINKIRKLLGRRLIVLANDHNGADVAVNGLKKIITARGFRFDSDVDSESGGETIGLCVEDWSQDLNEKLDLRKKTRINTAYTNLRGEDYPQSANQFIKHEVPELQKTYDRLEWF